MNILVNIILILFTFLASAATSYGGTHELVNLLGNKEYWSACTWGNFEESDMYRSTTWKLSGMSARGDVKTSDNYTAPVIINNLPVQEINMYVDDASKEASSFAMYSYNSSTTDDYRTFVDWCTARFGRPGREEERSENLGATTRTTITSYWTIENSLITVRTENNLSNGPTSVGFITTLSFAKSYRPNVTITNSIAPSKPDVLVEVPPISVPRAQRYVVVAPAVRPPPSTPGKSVPAFPGARSRSTGTSPEPTTASDGKRYQPPPYIWENEAGAIVATNEILDVPEGKRDRFEIGAIGVKGK